jgi:dienelactone hydrolase
LGDEEVILVLVFALGLQAKEIPGPGIPVPEKDRAELEAGLKELVEAMDGVVDYRKAVDIMVYHKAVDWALRYNEFYSPKEIAAAKELLKKATAPLTGSGPVIHGYRSKLDRSTQPYGLVLPVSYKEGNAKKYRLDLWLHGRDEKLTELKFIDQCLKSPGEFTPPDTFVLHLYGRFCNASKFAGEVDLFEALEDVQRRYPIDENRLVVRGFSMGGASTWHIAVHHAGLWAAAAPGAGFAETPVDAKLFNDPVKPTDYEQNLWHWYNATDYAANLFHCPVVAYSGELDPQRAAADMMAKAMKEAGLELVHIIGPKTEHQYEPEAKKGIARRIDELAAKGRNPTPDKIRFTTWTLRYPEMYWLMIAGLEKHWERASVDIDYRGGFPKATTSNVTRLRIDRPFKQIEIDGQVVAGGHRFLKKEGASWRCVADYGDSLMKQPGVQGPIDDAFLEPFVFVTPTGKPMNAAVGNWVAREQKEAVEAWRRTLRGDVRTVKDTELPSGVIHDNLILWGDPSSNKILAQIADKLPIRWTADGVYVGAKVYPADRNVPVLIYPNPWNPIKYVVLNSGFTWKENAALSNSRHVPLLPDWAVLDITVPSAKRMSERVVQAGFFGESWELPGSDAAAQNDPMVENERSAQAALKALHSANVDFWSKDRDNNQVKDVWVGDVSGLYRIDPGQGMLKLIDLSYALADASPAVALDADGIFPGDKKTKFRAAGKPAPKSGYLFVAMQKYQEEGAGPYLNYDTGNGRNPSRFAFCAYPSQYGKAGTFTYVSCESGTIFRKDTGGAPVRQWMSDRELMSGDWRKMD